MKKHISFQPERRLRSALRRPGGLTADEAIARAKQRLETIRDSTIEALDAKIDSLGVQVASGDTVDDLYFSASEIYAIAGSFGLKHVALAAESLCDLLTDEEMDEEAGSVAPTKGMVVAIGVHVDAFRALRALEGASDPKASEHLIAGLKQVVAHTLANRAR